MLDKDNRQQRIQDLASQIAALSEELSSLLNIDSTDPPSSAVSSSLPVPHLSQEPRNSLPNSLRFQVGDKVQILNNRNGLRGQTGVVTRTSRVFVYFTLDSSGVEIFRGRLNVRKLA